MTRAKLRQAGRGPILRLALATAAASILALVGVAATAQDDGPPTHAKLAGKMDLTKPDIYYGDPASPNISGFWRPANGVPRLIYTFADGMPLPPRESTGTQYGIPYKPEWQAAYMARRRSEARNLPYGDPAAACWPQGMYKNYIGYGSPIEITETPGRIQLVHERLTETRDIYTDGRGHPEGAALVHTAQGHSIGHWEGKTLVVDTIGVRKEFTLGTQIPHSDAVHFIEKFTRVDDDTLFIDILIDDPKAFTKPIRTTLTYKLWLNDQFSEDFCVENNRNHPDANLYVVVDLQRRKHYGFDLPQH